MTDDPNRPAGRDVRDEAREAGTRLADDAKTGARSAMSQATGYADQKAHEARDGMAGEVSDVATALRKAAESTRGGSIQEQAFQALAGSLADASDALKAKEPGDLFSEINGFARRNPLAFLGVAALAGFAVSRVAGATAHRGTGSYGREDDRYGSASSTGAARSVPPRTPGTAGVTPGEPGTASTVGATGTVGTPGTAGTSAAPGTAGTVGTPGTAGVAPSPGMSGPRGSAGATPGTYGTTKKGGV